MSWPNTTNGSSRAYVCGWCEREIASSQYFYCNDGSTIYICHFCEQPTYFRHGEQHPGAMYGSSVKNLPEDIEKIYEEIRRLHTVSAWTSAVLLSRKLLMNIAVDKGADEGKKFIEYVEYLCQNYVAPNNKSWIDKIRQMGNTATHKVAVMSQEDAQLLTDFLAMILKLIYEFVPPQGAES